jgi:molybdopterin-biosynthesis enzyme MoeA-like protein
MALLPELAQLRIAPGNELWPILQCENVFILPGVPTFFEAKVDTIATHFLGRRPLFTRKVVLGVDGA